MNATLIICIILLAFCIWDEMFNDNNGNQYKIITLWNFQKLEKSLKV